MSLAPGNTRYTLFNNIFRWSYILIGTSNKGTE